jgi:hypothetical protein
MIGDALDSLENTIMKHHDRLWKLQPIKQGLMQDLLSGEVSVTPLLEQ